MKNASITTTFSVYLNLYSMIANKQYYYPDLKTCVSVVQITLTIFWMEYLNEIELRSLLINVSAQTEFFLFKGKKF